MDYEKNAIEILRIIGSNSGFTVADSGGKDSSVLTHIAMKAGCPFEVVHNHTTVDAPETVYFIREKFKKLRAAGIKAEIVMPKETMWQLIVRKKTPPTRLIRYCCSELKERRSNMGLKDYTDTKNGPQLAVLKHAVIGDRIGEVKIEKGFLKFKGTMTDKHTKEVHHCTMAGCDCEDYKKHKLPCVHMYKLALEYGIYKDVQKRGFADKLAGLSDEAFAYFESAMYGGYYDIERDIEEGSLEKLTQKIKSELSREGLLEFHRGYFVFTNHVQSEIIGYILATFSDPRSIERRKNQ